jgi:predicted unusual protein kinase regulating ubiquinone biosynthesis (AarF/ABC1/UbiB family)
LGFGRTLKIFITLLPSFVVYYFDRKKFLGSDKLTPQDYERMRAHARRMVNRFIELGPAFVKLGQLLSVRSDILPQPYIDEFARLQDQVPQAPFEQIERELNEEYGDYRKVFDSFEPVAINAASLGQVHEATYRGRKVVVKVLRPNVERILEEDVESIRQLLPFMSLLFGTGFIASFEAALEQFYETARQEMDYRKEAQNMKILKQSLSDYAYVVVPNLYEEVSTRRVLVMERVDGIKITDVERIRSLGIDTRALARKISRLYLSMVLRMEIFHADPHPGNLAVTTDGRIVLYDYGMVGSMSREMRDNLMWLYMALAERNPSEIREALIELGVLDPFANTYIIERAIEMALSEMQGIRISEADIRMLMYVANRVIYRFPFRLPKELVLYLRMGLLLDSLCRTLDPDFNFLNVLPSLFREEGLYREYYISRLRRTFKRVLRAIDVQLSLPSLMQEYYQLEIERARSRRGYVQLVGAFLLGIIMAGVIFYLFHIR